MATRHSDGGENNGNGNGPGRGHYDRSPARLQKLYKEATANADAIRRVMEMLNSVDTAEKKKRGPAILMEALAIDGDRRATKKKHSPKPKHYGTVDARVSRRKQTLKILTKVGRSKTPTPTEYIGPMAGVLMRHGYLKREGDGYVRTDKEFIP